MSISVAHVSSRGVSTRVITRVGIVIVISVVDSIVNDSISVGPVFVDGSSVTAMFVAFGRWIVNDYAILLLLFQARRELVVTPLTFCSGLPHAAEIRVEAHPILFFSSLASAVIALSFIVVPLDFLIMTIGVILPIIIIPPLVILGFLRSQGEQGARIYLLRPCEMEN